MAGLEQLGSEKYVLLTTFRRDGRAVATPLWVVPDSGGGLGFWTVAESGKHKRIRNNGRVTVGPCDVRGTPTGDAVEAVARIGDTSDLGRIGTGIRKKYGMVGRLLMLGSRIRRGSGGTVAVLVN
ncbi:MULTISPECIES: PPOX class F420-dependent oxidoreductase [Actinoplanes]|uniref:PPOX class F420-dependent oxidoreductase n=1 Tax=Actinoplanes TaxID=1865 RepID=UPI0005F2953E|nr:MULTISPECIES: PPOX class F420-dependent oxidoreductase [Actinoplanes]GLY07187.1 PPOX class F420-dependent oxidoreductase [Actinoplanes sp. NBRC 101535]